jgi:hypothetical protein
MEQKEGNRDGTVVREKEMERSRERDWKEVKAKEMVRRIERGLERRKWKNSGEKERKAIGKKDRKRD